MIFERKISFPWRNWWKVNAERHDYDLL